MEFLGSTQPNTASASIASFYSLRIFCTYAISEAHLGAIYLVPCVTSLVLKYFVSFDFRCSPSNTKLYSSTSYVLLLIIFRKVEGSSLYFSPMSLSYSSSIN